MRCKICAGPVDDGGSLCSICRPSSKSRLANERGLIPVGKRPLSPERAEMAALHRKYHEWRKIVDGLSFPFEVKGEPQERAPKSSRPKGLTKALAELKAVRHVVPMKKVTFGRADYPSGRALCERWKIQRMGQRVNLNAQPTKRGVSCAECVAVAQQILRAAG